MAPLHSLFVFALCSSLSLAQSGINAFAITNSDEFNSAAQQIVSQNVPSSIQVGLGVAIQSAASSVASITSGDINSLVQSALTAETPAPFLTALPSQFQSNVQRIEFEISSLREAVSSTLVITRNITTIGNVTMLGNTTLYANSTLPATAAAVITSTNFEGSKFEVTVSATYVNATTSTPSATGTAGGQSGSSKGAGGAGSTSKSSAFAMPTHVPVAAAGILGVVGLLVAL